MNMGYLPCFHLNSLDYHVEVEQEHVIGVLLTSGPTDAPVKFPHVDVWGPLFSWPLFTEGMQDAQVDRVSEEV
jgi:hypothetical protein